MQALEQSVLELDQPLTLEAELLKAQVAPEVAAEFSHVKTPFKFRPHQTRGLQALLAWNRVGLFDEPRCGKSIIMAAACAYFSKYSIKSVLLMPPILFDQFVGELASLQGAPYRYHVLNQTPKVREKLLDEVREGSRKLDVLIMTKEIFKIHLYDLLLAGYSALFYDECHMGLQSCTLKTPKKALTTYGSVKYFVENAKESRLVLSTGTPLSREASDAYPLISLKSPHAYHSKNEFDVMHVVYRTIYVHGPRGRMERRVPAAELFNRMDILKRNLYHQSVRALRLEVLDCQRPNVQEVPIHLAPAHLALYKKVMKERILEIGDELIDARTEGQLRVLAMQMIVNPGVAGAEKIDNKAIEAIDAIMGTIRFPEAKLVLFANYNASVEFLAETYKKFDPVLVYGPNGSDNNRASAAKFTSDPKCALMIANPLSGGVGLTLGKVCQTIVMVEPVSTPGQFEQASSRVILAGQTDPVSIYLLRVLGTAAPKAIDTMLGRVKVNKEILMDKKSMLDDLLGRT